MAEDLHEKRVIVSTVLLTVLASSFVGALILYFGAESLAQLIFGNNKYVFEFQLFAFTLMTNAVMAVGLSYLRARQMPVLFVSIGAATLALQVALNIYFVVMLELHITGVVYSALLSGIVVALCLSAYVLLHSGIHWSGAIASKLVRFVLPLIVASLGAFYVAYADKYFLRVFGSLTEVGLYALAARVSSVLATVYEAFNMSWGADRFEIVKHNNAKQIYGQVFRIVSAVIISIAAGLALFSNDFFRVMTSPEFYSAGYIVPLLMIAVLAHIYTIFCNFGALYCDKTSIMAKASWLKAIIASVGYVVLIPYIGVYGAAITLALSGVVELIWVYRQSMELYDMGLRWRTVILSFAAATLCVLIGLMMPQGEFIYFSLRIVLFAILVLGIYFIQLQSADDRDMLKAVRKKSMFNFSDK